MQRLRYNSVKLESHRIASPKTTNGLVVLINKTVIPLNSKYSKEPRVWLSFKSVLDLHSAAYFTFTSMQMQADS